MPSIKLNIKKGDEVVVLTGKDRGKKGKVLSTSPREGKVTVEGINKVKKHARPTNKVPQGGIRELEAPIHVSNVKLVCPSCGEPTRVAHKLVSGTKVRSCKKCGESIDK